MSSLERTLERAQARIADGEYYEAHQTIRTLANRHVNRKAWSQAIDLLAGATPPFAAAGKFTEAYDLVQYLLEVYVKAGTPVDELLRSRLAQLLATLPPSEPFWKDLHKKVLAWSTANGSSRYGDQQLNHLIGLKLLHGNQFPLAETLLVLGTEASVKPYAEYLAAWALEAAATAADDTAAARAVGERYARAMVNYLYIRNLRYAKEAALVFLAAVASLYPATKIAADGLEVELVPTLPLVVLFQTLLVAVEHKSKDGYLKLARLYESELAATGLKPAVRYLGELYFDIPAPRENVSPFGNIFSQLMG